LHIETLCFNANVISLFSVSFWYCKCFLIFLKCFKDLLQFNLIKNLFYNMLNLFELNIEIQNNWSIYLKHHPFYTLKFHPLSSFFFIFLYNLNVVFSFVFIQKSVPKNLDVSYFWYFRLQYLIIFNKVCLLIAKLINRFILLIIIIYLLFILWVQAFNFLLFFLLMFQIYNVLNDFVPSLHVTLKN